MMFGGGNRLNSVNHQGATHYSHMSGIQGANQFSQASATNKDYYNGIQKDLSSVGSKLLFSPVLNEGAMTEDEGGILSDRDTQMEMQRYT